MGWAPDYVESADLKAYLRIDDTIDDAQLGFAIAAASRAVDDSAARQFGLVAAPEARVYTARFSSSRRRWVVDMDDLMTVAGLVVATAAGTITAYQLHPRNADKKGRPWTRLLVDDSSGVQPTCDVDGVTITARWGWTTVPVAVEQATLLQAARFFKRRDAPFGVAGSPDLGSEMRLLAKVDPDVEVALNDYRRTWVAV
jgi:hypothetical protein